MSLNQANLPKRIKVGGKYIGEGEPVFFIAEIGNNHNGDYYLAKKTIEEAAKAGANAVKLQKRFIKEVFTKEMQDRPQTKDQVFGKTYGEYRQHMELDMDEYLKLKKVAEDLGMVFFATPFDRKSVDFLEDVGVEVYKIASFDVTNLPLLDYVGQKGKPIFLSIGLSTWDEADEAVQTILRSNNQLIIKHCVSIYPTPDENLNLSTVLELRQRYAPLPIGYSGHEKDILPSLAAVAMGAKSIERHLTLDKSLPGPDHATVSIEPHEFRAMVEGTRRIEKSFGDPSNRLKHEEEIRVRNKHTKSLVAKIRIPAGTSITLDMLTEKSPGHGLKPAMKKKVVGKKVKVEIPEDTVITAELIDW